MNQANQPRLLHLGCGLVAPQGWVNLDGSWNAWIAGKPILKAIIRKLKILPARSAATEWPTNIVIHDLRKPLPFADGSFDGVFSSHVVEHLYRQQAIDLLRQVLRVLRPGGICRTLVPDLNALVREYLGQHRVVGWDVGPENDPARRFNRRLCMMAETPPRSGFLYSLYAANTNFHQHKQMYDGDSLKLLMEEAGFVDCRPQVPLQSKIPTIELVEKMDRTTDGTIVEGIKPQ